MVAERERLAHSDRIEEGNAERVTVSLPARVAAYARGSAESRGEAVSAFIADALRDRQRREMEDAMIRGLLEDAEADRELVRDWDETLPNIPD